MTERRDAAGGHEPATAPRRRGRNRRTPRFGQRGQANLLAVAVALIVVTSVLGASVAIAESLLVDATEERDAADRHAATTLAARLVADAPASYPPGTVPNRTALSAAELEQLSPAVDDAAVTVELDGRTLFERGDVSDGVTVYRGVLIGTPQSRQERVDLGRNGTVTLAHRTQRVDLVLAPGPNTTIQTVRVNDRVVLHNETGLTGTATVPTSPRRPTELAVETSTTAVTAGHVNVSYVSFDREPATLAVTVDD